MTCGLLKSETVGAYDILNKSLSGTCGVHVKRRIKLVTKLLVHVARICAFWNCYQLLYKLVNGAASTGI